MIENRLVRIELSTYDTPLTEYLSYHKLTSIMSNLNCDAPEIKSIYCGANGWVVTIASQDFLEVPPGGTIPMVLLDSFMFGVSKRDEFPWDKASPTYPFKAQIASLAPNGNIILSNNFATGITWPPNWPASTSWSKPEGIITTPKAEHKVSECNHHYKHWYGKLEICIHCNETRNS